MQTEVQSLAAAIRKRSTTPLRTKLAVSAAMAMVLGACVAVDDQDGRGMPLQLGPAGASAQNPNSARDQVRASAPEFQPPEGAVAAMIQKGTGEFVASPLQGARSRRGNIVIKLVDVEAEEAVQQVLGDMLGVNYVIETDLEGTVTIQTNTSVDQRTALQLLSSALAGIEAVLLNDGGFYRVVSTERAGAASTAVRYGAGPSDIRVGPGVQIVPLRYVAALEMEKILTPLAGEGAIARVDVSRNLLILKDDARNLEAMLEMIDMFDVNYLAGMSFAMVPVKNTSAIGLVTELEQVFGVAGDSPMAGLIRFVPIERLNAVLAIASQPDHIDQVQDWMQRLDRFGQMSDQSFYVVPLQNRSANEVADVLQATLSTDAASSRSMTNGGVQPGMTAVVTSSEAPEGAAVTVPGQVNAAGVAPEARIRADDANNSLVILATPGQFQALERVIDMLDVSPNQVMLEATIAEVTLRDDLAYGLTWFLRSGDFDLTFSNAENGAVAETFPGFSVLFSGDDGRAALSAVASVTDVKVLSSPTLMVLDNRTATLQVGDEVPIVTQTSVSTIDPDAPIVNQVSLRDTGVILKVTPRVNDGGRVMLDIEQEVSDVVETQTSGIDSPTIQQRRIQTTVAVDDGSTIALGGLIRDRVTDVNTRIPLLGDIPGLGELFRSTTKKNERTELIVLITPRVVTNGDEAQRVTQELRDRMRGVGLAIEAAAERSVADE